MTWQLALPDAVASPPRDWIYQGEDEVRRSNTLCSVRALYEQLWVPLLWPCWPLHLPNVKSSISPRALLCGHMWLPWSHVSLDDCNELELSCDQVIGGQLVELILHAVLHAGPLTCSLHGRPNPIQVQAHAASASRTKAAPVQFMCRIIPLHLHDDQPWPAPGQLSPPRLPLLRLPGLPQQEPRRLPAG